MLSWQIATLLSLVEAHNQGLCNLNEALSLAREQEGVQDMVQVPDMPSPPQDYVERHADKQPVIPLHSADLDGANETHGFSRSFSRQDLEDGDPLRKPQMVGAGSEFAASSQLTNISDETMMNSEGGAFAQQDVTSQTTSQRGGADSTLAISSDLLQFDSTAAYRLNGENNNALPDSSLAAHHGHDAYVLEDSGQHGAMDAPAGRSSATRLPDEDTEASEGAAPSHAVSVTPSQLPAGHANMGEGGSSPWVAAGRLLVPEDAEGEGDISAPAQVPQSAVGGSLPSQGQMQSSEMPDLGRIYTEELAAVRIQSRVRGMQTRQRMERNKAQQSQGWDGAVDDDEALRTQSIVVGSVGGGKSCCL